MYILYFTADEYFNQLIILMNIQWLWPMSKFAAYTLYQIIQFVVYIRIMKLSILILSSNSWGLTYASSHKSYVLIYW